MERADLTRQRDLLKRKLAALEGGGWDFDPSDGKHDPAAVTAELDAITTQLEALGADDSVLQTHLEIVAGLLAEPERQLWSQEVTLCVDAMNILRDAQGPSTRQMVLHELCNARGGRAVILYLSLTPGDLPEREDFVTAAQRYLY